MTVGELGRRLTSAELTEWMAFARIEPLGGRRLDWGFALLGCIVANLFRDKPVQMEELMPVWEDATPAEVKEIVADVRAFVAALGGPLPGERPGKGRRAKQARKPQEGPSQAKRNGPGPKRNDVHLSDPRNDPSRIR